MEMVKEKNKNGILKFEGEDFKGKDCQEKNKNGILKFEGEYFKGKRLTGKEYNYDGILQFEGEYLNGKRGKVINLIIKIIKCFGKNN